jgi:hypothetical protein
MFLGFRRRNKEMLEMVVASPTRLGEMQVRYQSAPAQPAC